MCFSKSWAAQKVHVGKLFALSRFYFFLQVTKKGLFFVKPHATKIISMWKELALHLNCIGFNWWSMTSTSRPLWKMKCLCLEQWLHLFLAVLPSLCQKSKDWASPPASHKPIPSKGLDPDPSHQIFRCWGAHQHLCPCLPLSNTLFGMLFLFWREPRCWIHLQGLVWSYMKHWKSLITLRLTSVPEENCLTVISFSASMGFLIFFGFLTFCSLHFFPVKYLLYCTVLVG